MLFHRGDGVLRKREKQRVNSCDLLSEKIYHFPNGLKIINYYICFFGDCFNLRVVSLDIVSLLFHFNGVFSRQTLQELTCNQTEQAQVF